MFINVQCADVDTAYKFSLLVSNEIDVPHVAVLRNTHLFHAQYAEAFARDERALALLKSLDFLHYETELLRALETHFLVICTNLFSHSSPTSLRMRRQPEFTRGGITLYLYDAASERVDEQTALLSRFKRFASRNGLRVYILAWPCTSAHVREMVEACLQLPLRKITNLIVDDRKDVHLVEQDDDDEDVIYLAEGDL